MKPKISYRKRWSPDGTVYDQAISIDVPTYLALDDAVRAEIAQGYPRQEQYVSSYYTLYLKPLKVESNNIVWANHTQMRFINMFLKLRLLDRNTYLMIRER